jgi:hypothetical protein
VIAHQDRPAIGARERRHSIVLAGNQQAIVHDFACLRENVVRKVRRQINGLVKIGHQLRLGFGSQFLHAFCLDGVLQEISQSGKCQSHNSGTF